MRFATFLMRSTSPTEVPPYFCTMRAMFRAGLNGPARCRLARRECEPCVITPDPNHLYKPLDSKRRRRRFESSGLYKWFGSGVMTQGSHSRLAKRHLAGPFNPARNMALIVQKYGGTSVGDVDRIKNVAKRIQATRDDGHG